MLPPSIEHLACSHLSRLTVTVCVPVNYASPLTDIRGLPSGSSTRIVPFLSLIHISYTTQADDVTGVFTVTTATLNEMCIRDRVNAVHRVCVIA